MVPLPASWLQPVGVRNAFASGGLLCEQGRLRAGRGHAVGRIISAMTCASMAGVTTGAGLYAPMPPVLGPTSPSPTALWSWQAASGSAVSPSTSAKKEASSPARKSSTTTEAPAAPKALPTNIISTAAHASATDCATTTPLPAASPSAWLGGDDSHLLCLLSKERKSGAPSRQWGHRAVGCRPAPAPPR